MNSNTYKKINNRLYIYTLYNIKTLDVKVDQYY